MQRGARTLAAALVAGLSAGCGGTTTVTEARTVTATVTTNGLGPPAEMLVFGHVESLLRVGARYELRFDPAWFLTGETANRAAAEDGQVEPGEPVPNDAYVVDEGARLLTYVVPADAAVTVLTRQGDPAQIGATPITVAELAELVDGTSDLELFEPLATGVWVRVRIDTVRSIEQQYRP